MSLKLYEDVSLRRDVPEEGLKQGDVATLVEIVPGPPGQPRGAVLEVFNALGHTVCVTSVSVEDIEPLREDEVLSVRKLARAG
jgi:hypothetical protein